MISARFRSRPDQDLPGLGLSAELARSPGLYISCKPPRWHCSYMALSGFLRHSTCMHVLQRCQGKLSLAKESKMALAKGRLFLGLSCLAGLNSEVTLPPPEPSQGRKTLEGITGQPTGARFRPSLYINPANGSFSSTAFSLS